MNYYIELRVWVDPEANFLDSDPRYHETSVGELLRDMIYDIDDVKVNTIKVEEE